MGSACGIMAHQRRDLDARNTLQLHQPVESEYIESSLVVQEVRMPLAPATPDKTESRTV